jgi:hypothetical protein
LFLSHVFLFFDSIQGHPGSLHMDGYQENLDGQQSFLLLGRI